MRVIVLARAPGQPRSTSRASVPDTCPRPDHDTPGEQASPFPTAAACADVHVGPPSHDRAALDARRAGVDPARSRSRRILSGDDAVAPGSASVARRQGYELFRDPKMRAVTGVAGWLVIVGTSIKIVI